jgi:GxxExxY protein
LGKEQFFILHYRKIKNDYSNKDGERDPLTGKIIEACYHVHNELGPGFVERIYMNALKIALEKQKLIFTAETEFVVRYAEQPIGKFRADLLVENKVIVELKAVEGKMPMDCTPGVRQIRLGQSDRGYGF